MFRTAREPINREAYPYVYARYNRLVERKKALYAQFIDLVSEHYGKPTDIALPIIDKITEDYKKQVKPIQDEIQLCLTTIGMEKLRLVGEVRLEETK